LLAKGCTENCTTHRSISQRVRGAIHFSARKSYAARRDADGFAARRLAQCSVLRDGGAAPRRSLSVGVELLSYAPAVQLGAMIDK
jgi:hypothetical protein